jgi:hypothetical protein
VVVHGMLIAPLFTCLLGTRIPGCVYLNQTLEFVRPVYALQPVEGTVMVTGRGKERQRDPRATKGGKFSRHRCGAW